MADVYATNRDTILNFGGGTVTQINTGTGLTGGPITTTGTISIADTTVVPGTYTNATFTVNQQGQLTAASSGTAGVTAVTASSPLQSSGGTTPNISFIDQSANLVLAGPAAGPAAPPTFRFLVAADFPSGVFANVSLSNLVPTSINQSLVPDINTVRDLGAASLAWNQLFISTIYDPSGIASISSAARFLQDSAGSTSLAWASATEMVSFKDFIPDTDAVHNLGNNGISWAAVYTAAVRASNASPFILPGLGQLRASTGDTSADWQGRLLYDATPTTSLDWGARTLLDSSNFPAFNWATRVMTDVTNQASLNGDTRILVSSTNLTSLDWENRDLFDAANLTSIEWGNRTLFDSGANLSLNWDNRTTVDSAGSTTIDWENRDLITSASDTSLDWEIRRLFDSSTTLSEDWEIRRLYDSAAVITIDWGSRILRDSSATLSTNWETRVLINSASDITADWESMQLNDAATLVAVDWGTRNLLNTSSSITVDWENSTLVNSGSGNPSLDWGNSQLINSNGDAILVWSGPSNIVLFGDNNNARLFSFNDGANSNSINFRAPNSLGSSTDYIWPSVDGSSGQFLQTDGSGNLSWQTASGSSSPFRNISANDSITSADGTLFIDTTGGALSIALPDPTTVGGQPFTIYDSGGVFNTNNVTLTRFAAENINGLAASKLLQTNFGVFRLTSNGTNWFVG